MPFDKQGSNYKDVSEKLQKMEKAGKPKILSIHFPGTGGRANDGFPTYKAIKHFVQKYPDTPVIFLEGVGSVGNNYIPPVMADVDSLENTVKPLKKRFWSAGVSEPEAWPALGLAPALVGGIVLGSGKQAHVKRMINLLTALDEDGNLPQEVILTGHSRGSITCNELGNAIYMHFGNRTKLHFIETDPVSGPFHEGALYEQIIPPNTETFTAFYAPEEGGALLNANDLTKLAFTNPTTTITAYAVPGTDHVEITASNPVVFAAYSLLCGIHNENPSIRAESSALHNPEDIVGKGVRAKSSFYHRTPVYCESKANLTTAVHNVRKLFETGYDSEKSINIEKIEYSCPEVGTNKQRQALLEGVYKDLKEKMKKESNSSSNVNSFFASLSPSSSYSLSSMPFFSKTKPNEKAVNSHFINANINLDSFTEIKSIQRQILIEAAANPLKQGSTPEKCNFTDERGQWKSGYITCAQKQTLDLIREAAKSAKDNPLSPSWGKALKTIESIAVSDTQKMVSGSNLS